MPEGHLPEHVMTQIEAVNPWDMFTIPLGAVEHPFDDILDVEEELSLEEEMF